MYARDLYFWDIVGPIAFILFIAGIIYSIWGLKKKLIKPLLISALISGIFGFISLWSIGRYVLFIALLQLLGALNLIIKRKYKNNSSNDKIP